MSIITKQTLVALAAGLACAGGAAWAQTSGAPSASAATESPHHYGFGSNASADDLKQFVSPLPDGRGLPKGSGTVMQGEKIYMQQCLACHGAKLEGGIGDRLIGGRGTLAKKTDSGPAIKTVESYWPYATTLFDYIKRAMPFTSPNSMSNDDVYAVTAYILSKANIVPQDATLDQDSLAKVEMPNRNGFKPADR
ncbi:c-type cytochrome [Eoetvoesiella caeni]|uniref:Cytochrome c n=1 Tax=Eoetvoesiella caeni TaxID=645616 RepID=A0A366H3U4_9BURK|nr:c-type cytochrome [Eoetvoesiella caeni]NYT56748.1 c-type cytochrome [Eoetvoesiella caeni]RBP35744.1 cytochrome c [Eoetvoesiella caeni]